MINNSSNNNKVKKGLLRPEELVRIKDLFIFARQVVEGFATGHHKSPFKGFSLEFAEHRKYVLGDELKHVDWKVYGRTQKYFVKLYEAETNMRVHILLDRSNSMNFSFANAPSKILYSTYLSAALAYIVSKQQDLAGLVTFNDTSIDMIPARNSTVHLKILMDKLSSINANGKTSIANAINQLAQKLKKRGLIIIISDLLDESSELIKAITRLKHSKHEIIVFHVLDNAEISFPYKVPTTFLDMEGSERITVDPIALRKEYIDSMNHFQKEMKTSLSKMNVDYVLTNTMVPFEYVLSNYLNMRRKIS
ncbi:MAG: hypothetical protein ACD_79C00811G0003 [uncultured bacterium]|nr:MAG: hypothetical protein ACD_79C00811G0003 [uncultured bacterium]